MASGEDDEATASAMWASRRVKRPVVRRSSRDYQVVKTMMLNSFLVSFVVISTLFHHRLSSLAIQVPDSDGKIRVRIGVLLEESDHEQANMFIRTIKMINERGDETIRQLLSLSSFARRQPAAAGAPTTTSKRTRRLAPDEPTRRPPTASHINSAHHWPGANGSESVARPAGQNNGARVMRAGERRPHHAPSIPEHEYHEAAGAALGSNSNETDYALVGAMSTIEKPINNDKPSGVAQGPDDESELRLEENKFSASTRENVVRQHRRRSIVLDEDAAAAATDDDELARQTQHFKENSGPNEDGAIGAEGDGRAETGARPRASSNIRLEPMIEFLNDGQSALEADQKVCQLIESGVHAIVGPLDGNSIQHVQSICDNLEIPYFELRPFVGGTLVAPIPVPITPPSGSSGGGGAASGANSASSSTSLSPSSAFATATPLSIVDSSKIQLLAKGEQSATAAAAAATATNKQRRLKHNTNNNHQLAEETPDAAGGSAAGTTSRQRPRKKRRRKKNNNSNNKSIERHEQRFAATLAQNQRLVNGERNVSPLDNDVDQSGAADSPATSAVFQFKRNGAGEAQSSAAGPPKQSRLGHQHDQEEDRRRQLSTASPSKSGLAGERHYDAEMDAEEEDEEEADGEDADDEGDDDRDELSASSAPPVAINESSGNSKGSAGGYDRDSPRARPTADTTGQDSNLSSSVAWSTPSADGANAHSHHAPAFQPAESVNNKLEDLTINLYPPSHLLTSAYIDMIYALNWTSFAIVYEDGASMIKLQDLLRESSSGTWSSRWKIRLFRYDAAELADSEGGERAGHRGAQDKSAAADYDNIYSNKISSPVAPPTTERPIASALHRGDDDNDSSAAATHSEPHESPEVGQLFGESDYKLNGDNSTRRGSTAQTDGSSSNSIRATRSDRPSEPRHDSLTSDDLLIDHQQDLLLQQDAPSGNKFYSSASPARRHFSSASGNGKQANGASTFRDVFWRIKLTGEQNILLDVRTENLYDALKQAQQVGCVTEEYSFLITSLDLHTIDLEDFKYSRTKITGFSLIHVAKQQQSILRGADAAHRFRANAGDMSSRNRAAFDERYLENLGIVHLVQQDAAESPQTAPSWAREPISKSGLNVSIRSSSSSPTTTAGDDPSRKAAGGAPISSSGNKWLSQLESEAANNDQTRRELLQSSPASLSLLPTVNRNNEQRLFDFFLQQQEHDVSRTRLSTASAILHDSLVLYMMGLQELDPSGNFLGNPQAITCSLESQPWSHGSSMVNYMRQISFSGLTGDISFDQRGLRTNFKLDVMGMAPNLRLVKVGEWHSGQATGSRGRQYSHQRSSSSTDPSQQQQQQHSKPSYANTTAPVTSDPSDTFDSSGRSYEELSSRYELEFKKYTRLLAGGQKIEVPYTKRVSPNGALQVNEIIFERLYHDQADQVDTLIVTAKLSQPYFMLKETPNKLDGNDQFEGYAVDLIHELSKLVNFKYKWREVADKKYGSKEVLPNGTVVWNGMIGEIVRGVADLAIVDLTITAQREEAVDFTLPFMNTGISILFKKPTTKVTTLFSFLSPFSSDVWAYVLAAYCGISAILFLVGHLSPYEWADPHPCRHITKDDDAKVLKNQFSLLNSFWFTIGSLMQQGSDLTPRSMSTRTIAGIWYFFTLIMISSYTANLAAFLTVEKVVYPIENVRDLSNQQEIKYGCVESGSTCLFFHDSQIDTYKKINENMRGFKTNVRSNDEGQKRVGEGKFAFFMESTTIEYIIERNCNLTQIGGLIDSKGYGLATSKKSRYKRPYRTLLNEGILHLQETGMLHVLKNRWWKERRGGGTCTDDGKGGGVTELSLANVGGVFVVLLGGLGISFLVAIAEFMWRARRGGSNRDRMCEEMMNDLKFALACKSSTKPNKKSGRGSSRSRVAMLSQQDSTMSQYQFDDSLDPSLLLHYQQQAADGGCGDEFVAPPYSSKECDPILLHAMLTMLMQQQQQQQQVAQLAPSFATPRRDVVSDDSVEAEKRQILANNGIKQQRGANNGRIHNHLGANQQTHGSSTSFIDESLSRGAPGVAHTQQQQQQQQRLYNNWIQANHVGAGSRRRTLQSQQTIDLADDNLSNVPINHFN